MKTRQLKLSFHRPQTALFREFVRNATICMAFGRGLGKSWFARTLAYLLIQQWDGVERETLEGHMRGVRIVFLMPTFKQFKDIHSRLMEDELATRWKHLAAKIDHTTWSVSFPGGSSIQVFPASDHGSQRARGIRCDVVFGDECDDIDPSVFYSVVQPWFTEPWSLNMRCLGGTPKRGRHGLLWEVFNRGKLGEKIRSGEDVAITDPDELSALSRHFSCHAWYRHAPEVVAPERVADARATTPPAVFRREWECDFDAAEGLVYGDVFESGFHVREHSPNQVWSEILIGCDHGWEHPGVFLMIGVIGNGKDAVCHVIDEVYEQHQPDQFWKAKLREWLSWYPRALFYGDPSQPKTLDAYRSECKARVQECDNSVDEGIRAVADRFVTRILPSGERVARLYVSPRCQSLIRELGMYRRKRDPKNPEAYLEAIDKRNDDACDALRYALFNRFGPVTATERRYGRAELRQ